MVLSLGGWLGAMVGCVVGAIVYGFMLPFFTARLGRPTGPLTLEQREALEQRFSVTRRGLLAVFVGGCGALGYWLGKTLG
jgi:hypothetical protein